MYLGFDICQIAGPDYEESPNLVTVRGLEPANARVIIQPPAPLNLPLKGTKVEVGFGLYQKAPLPI